MDTRQQALERCWLEGARDEEYTGLIERDGILPEISIPILSLQHQQDLILKGGEQYEKITNIK